MEKRSLVENLRKFGRAIILGGLCFSIPVYTSVMTPDDPRDVDVFTLVFSFTMMSLLLSAGICLIVASKVLLAIPECDEE